MTILAGKIILADDFGGLTNPWVTWSPTLTNLTLGNGTVTARHRIVGKTFDYHFKFVLGSTSAVGTSPRFSLPATLHSSYVTLVDSGGIALLLDAGVNNYPGSVRIITSTQLEIMAALTSGTHATVAAVTATAPFSWGTGDSLSCSGTLELT